MGIIGLLDIKPFLPVVAFTGWMLLGRTKALQWLALGVNLLVVSIVEPLAYWEATHQRYNLWLYNSYFCVQAPLVGWLLSSLSPSKRTGWVVLAAVIAASLMFMADADGSDFFEHMYTRTAMLNTVLFSILFLIVLFEMAQHETIPLLRNPAAWVALAHLIFFGSTIPLTGLFNYLMEHDEALAERLYVLNDIPYALYYVMLFGVLFVMLRKPMTTAA